MQLDDTQHLQQARPYCGLVLMWPQGEGRTQASVGLATNKHKENPQLQVPNQFSLLIYYIYIGNWSFLNYINVAIYNL